LTAQSTINVPFPNPRLASVAIKALSVDLELSPFVKRSFSLIENDSVLQIAYTATTNRMLRVAVNGFFESLGVVLGVMEELDVDTIMLPGKESVEGAQGLVHVPGGEEVR